MTPPNGDGMDEGGVPPRYDARDDRDDVPIDAGDLPTVAHASSEFEAEAIRAVLDDAGIRTVIVPCGANLFGFPLGPGGKGIPVKVLPDDLSRAREALSRARFVGRSVDWDDVDIGEMPPDVRATFERGWVPRRAGGTLVFVGGIIAAGIGVLALGGLVMWIWQALRGVRSIALLAGLHALAAPAACAVCVALVAGCAYTLEGRAVEGHGTIDVVDSKDADSGPGGKPVAGVRIDLIRDPSTGNRARVASAVSGKDGTFKLTVEAFGAGWMEEEWLVRASRSGYQNVEVPMSLPGSTGGRVMMVTVARGRSERFQDPENSEALLDEARRYDPGVGGISR